MTSEWKKASVALLRPGLAQRPQIQNMGTGSALLESGFLTLCVATTNSGGTLQRISKQIPASPIPVYPRR